MSTPSISNLRRRAAKLGWSFHRSRLRKNMLDNEGGYQLIAGSRTSGTVIDGALYDASLEQIADRIAGEERRLA